MNIHQKLDDLLLEIIIDKNPQLLDDELSDILNNERLVQEAKDEILEKLNDF